MRYKTQPVQALAAMWDEWEPAIMKSLETASPFEQILYEQLFKFLKIPSLLQKLDESPEAVETIRKGLMKVVDAMDIEERKSPRVAFMKGEEENDIP